MNRQPDDLQPEPERADAIARSTQIPENAPPLGEKEVREPYGATPKSGEKPPGSDAPPAEAEDALRNPRRAPERAPGPTSGVAPSGTRNTP